MGMTDTNVIQTLPIRQWPNLEDWPKPEDYAGSLEYMAEITARGLDCECSPFFSHECGRPEPPQEPKPMTVAIPKPPALAGLSQYVRAVTLDVADVLPTIYTRSDGGTLLYEGKLNTLYGLPGVGKTWVAIDCAKQVTAQGGRVIWWDYEDKPDTLGNRAKLLGFSDASNQEKVLFVDAAVTENEKNIRVIIKALLAWVMGGERPGLIVLDAAERAGCPSDGADVAPFFKRMVDPFLAGGASFLLLDHIPKNTDGRAAGGIGSQHKLARVDGAALKVSGKPWNRIKGGRINLTLEKDRQGQLPCGVNEVAAVISGDYANGAFTYTVGQSSGDNTASMLGDKVLVLLAASEGGISGQRAIRDILKCKPTHLTTALNDLSNDGLISIEKQGRNSTYRISPQGIEAMADIEVQGALITQD